jgi:hypothetical protein
MFTSSAAACCVTRRYPKESILVHELAHAVMNLGLDKQQRRRVEGCYEHAKAQQLYDPGALRSLSEECPAQTAAVRTAAGLL